jgi:hypothetical protein
VHRIALSIAALFCGETPQFTYVSHMPRPDLLLFVIKAVVLRDTGASMETDPGRVLSVGTAHS